MGKSIQKTIVLREDPSCYLCLGSHYSITKDLFMKKNYYFYNSETGCDWEEDMTSTKKERFLENRPWIEEGDTARESYQKWLELKKNTI